MSSSIAPTELAFMVGHVVEGRSFALASFVLVSWDYFLTLDQEVLHFWSGSWSISRILFLSNRYFTLGLLSFRILVDFYPGLFPSETCSCDVALRVNFPLNLGALAVIQGILILRLWYLFKSSKTARYCLLFAQLHSHLVKMPGRGLSFCADPPPSQFWLVFVPSFLLHGLLSLFMVIRVVQNVRSARHLPLLRRCIRDGGFLYMVIFFSVSFSISAAIVGVSPSVGVVAMFSNFMLALLSLCVSRVILHLSALARAYSFDPVSQAPALLLHTAKVDRSWETRMGCLLVDDDYSDIVDDKYY
ncbi:hypothetical protein B0H10DRAFT_1984078 [Mycena sp. CBHHK59/15]|nr:hypothetical protein B0H10DRAFT_1984078 [Mycena sp. CBHHK59/15]